MRLSQLTEGLKVLTEKGPAVHQGKRAQKAAVMARKAQHRGDQQAYNYWKTVYQNAMKRMPGTPAHHAANQPKGGQGGAATAAPKAAAGGQAAAQGGGGSAPAAQGASGAQGSAPAAGQPAGHGAAAGGAHGAAGEHPAAEGPKGFSARFKAAKEAVKKASAALTDKIKSAPAATKRLVTDSVYRHKIGKAVAGKLKRMPGSILRSMADEVKEVGKAGLVVVKAARGKKLTHEDKHILKAGAKALATTVIGTIAMGGIAHLTATALAGHFAAETAVKAVGKAALFASVLMAEEASATTLAWVNEVIQGIKDGFDGLGDMDEEKLIEILASVHPAA